MARDLSNRGYNADYSKRYGASTPVGDVYGGYGRNTDTDNTVRDRAYAGIGDYLAALTRVRPENGNTSYHASVDMPQKILPEYFNEMNTPLGSGYLATNFPEPGIEAGFLPNDKTQAYINALSRLLGR